MKPMPDQMLERMRQLAAELEVLGVSGVGTGSGVFAVRREGVVLRMVGSHMPDWEHVSVSLKKRCPTWEEMCFVKDLFWAPEECVMQLHPPKEDWVNNHPYCLHLWRPLLQDIPRPPAIYVGAASEGELSDEAALALHRKFAEGQR